MQYPKLILLCIFGLSCFFNGKAQISTSITFSKPAGVDPNSARQMDSLMMIREHYRLNPFQQNQFTDFRDVPTSNIKQGLSRPTATSVSPVAFQNAGSQPGNNGIICSVISGRDFLKQDSLVLYSGDPSMLPDGNIILSGAYTDYSFLPYINSGAFCVKTTVNGDMIWGILLDSATISNDFLNLRYSLPLQNGDILLAGRTDNRTSGNNDFVLARLDGYGNLLWLKSYQSRYWQGFNGSGDYFKIADLDEDPVTGDIYFTGGHYFGKSTVTKISGATGSVIWSRTYKRWLTDIPFGLELHDNSMVLFTMAYDQMNSQFINILRLSKSTGDTISTKSFKEIRGSIYEPAVYQTFGSKKTANGHYLLSGPTTRYYEYPAYTGTVDLFHASVVELDENFNFVKSYGIKNRIESNGYNTKLSLFEDGSSMFTMLKYISGYTAQTLISLLKNDTIYHRRNLSNINEGVPYEPMTLQLPDGGVLNTKLMGDSTALATSGSRINYYRAHTADTASVCMGIPDTSSTVWYRNFQPNYSNYADSVTSNVFSESLPKTYTEYRFSTHRVPGCVIESNCDTLDIYLSNRTVCLGSSVVVTVHKNRGCGSLVPLAYNSSAIEQIATLSDSTFLFRFNAIGTFSISGSIQGCQLITDTLQITVLPAPGPVNLGGDTSLCSGNNIVLHAGSQYATYTWQDASTDSLLTVTVPGIYYVLVTDACGNTYADTIEVNAAAFPFSIGPDRAKCNADTVMLMATPGFINYQWQNNYQISGLTGPNVIVNPLVDTFYYASAEKWPGCVVRDTVRITVNTSPAIQLGADTSLCAGDSLILTAGPGFSVYLWNTGAGSSTISVIQPGQYSVSATASNGCISSDTFTLLPNKPLPVFSLGPDSTLCDGQYLNLQVNLPQATYLWQDGSQSNSYVVTQPGWYILVVSQQGCSSTDSLRVWYKPSPIVQLGNDNVLCHGQTLLLDAGNYGATYQWQDGSTSQYFSASATGVYSVIANLNGCKATGSMRLTVDPKPAFNLGIDTSICLGQGYRLQPMLNTAAQYLWQDGSTGPFITITKAGLYTLTATNHCGLFTDSLLVSEALCRLMLPNAFTPNGDGYNDIFKVKYPYDVKTFSLSIYNRYGEKIFETDNMSKGWNGRFRSMPQENGAYIWIIRIKNLDDTLERHSGTVMLFR